MNQVEVEVIDPTELAKRLNVPETCRPSYYLLLVYLYLTIYALKG